MINSVQLMMALIRSEITGNQIEKTPFESLTEENWRHLYKLAKHHDLTHLIADAAIKAELLSEGEIKAQFEKQLMTSVYRFKQIQYELGEIKRVLNEAQIPFIPLKGSVIREYYPEPWMRTSCDIDVLVREENLKNARLVIETGLHYTFETMGDHDIGAISPSGVHLELHYQLNDVNIRHKSDLLLTRVWDYVQESDVACKELQDEMFYFYHIMHMAKHFENGGCGIRPFIDLWILNRMLKCDPVKKEKLLVEGGLTTFAQAADQLSNVWMEQAEHTQLTRKMEEYILTGGVYGTQTNQIAIYQSKKGGKVGYILYRIWMPYSSLCVLYPSLKGKRVLQPFYEIRRWLRLLNSGIFTRSKKELKTSLSVSNENKNQIKHLLSQIGLN